VAVTLRTLNRVAAAALGALALVGCADERSWTILYGREALLITSPCSRQFPNDLSDMWFPSPLDVDRAEKQLPSTLSAMLNRIADEHKIHVPQSYVRQYVGYRRNGRKVLYVNGLGWDVENVTLLQWIQGDTWRDKPMFLCDGGLSGFGAVFDLEANRFDTFSFDGTFAGFIPMKEQHDQLSSRGDR
jgi:hypothetical protein